MKMKKIAALLTALTLLPGGCGFAQGTETATEAAAQTLTETALPEKEEDLTETIDVTALSGEEYREYLISRSLLSTGDTARFKSVIRRAESGEEITVAYIGGSITEGLTAGAEKCWARLSYEQLCADHPDAKINFVNAGMSGTPSTLGVIRAQRDVIEPYGAPDIVFIEFAVNDGQSALDKNAYESLVRKMLSLKEDTAVFLLFTVLKNGYSCESSHMRAIGEHYGLPMISVGTALNDEFESGRTPWEKYSDDESHPNEWGHVLVKDFVVNCFNAVLSAEDKPGAGELPEPLYGADYEQVALLDRSCLTPSSLGEYNAEKATIAQFPNGWTRKGGENEGITFDMRFKSLFIVYHCGVSDKFGTAEVYVDGEKTAGVRSSDKNGWNNPVAQLVFTGQEEKPHTVTIKMAEGHEDSFFGILGFGCTS